MSPTEKERMSSVLELHTTLKKENDVQQSRNVGGACAKWKSNNKNNYKFNLL